MLGLRRAPAVSTLTAAALLASTGACRVYNPNLVNQRDGGSEGSTGDGGGSDGGTDAAVDTSPDAAATCDPVLAMGAPCIEAFTGQGFAADDPRSLAPASIAVLSTAPRLALGDVGTGRVMTYEGGMAHRLAGTGALGVPTMDGPATDIPLSAPRAMLPLPGGDLLIGDAVARALYVQRAATGRLERFGREIFQQGPSALALMGPSTLLLAANNQVSAIALGATPGTSMPLVGSSCGLDCRGFNATPTGGSSTLLNLPTGIDTDSDYIYIADSQNCRIRRADRVGTPQYRTVVFAGAGCERDAPILPDVSPTVPAAMARLGPVGDVRVGADGAVYFTDPDAHCAVLAVPTTGPTAGQLSVVAGSAARCGVAGAGGSALGHLGGLAMSADRTALFAVDRQNRRVWRVPISPTTGPGAPTMVLDTGAFPSMTETLATARVGSVSGLAASGTAATPIVFIAGAAEGRVYRTEGGRVSVVTGDGRERLNTAMPGATVALEPGQVAGLAFADGALAVGMTEHSAVAVAIGANVSRVAGTYDTPGDPRLMGGAASDTLVAPGWPVFAGANLVFATQGPAARVFRVDGASGSNPLTTVAGIAPGADAGTLPPGGSAPATTIALGRPAGLAYDAAGNLYIADTDNSVVWRVRTDGAIEIAAGRLRERFPLEDADSDPRAVAIPTPVALAFDGRSTLYIADQDVLRVRALDLMRNRLVTVAGSGPPAPNGALDTGDGGDARRATLGRPAALAWLDGRLFVGMANTGRVRVVRFPSQ